jgi:patatin-like phospholipase/acyl hydrolase
LFDKNLKYREKRGMKWITMMVGTFLFGILGWFIVPLFVKLTNSFYDRTGLEQVTKDLFGTFKITDTLTDEIMIVTYDMLNHVPVIFTKDAARKNETMNVYIRDAAQASSAAPIYFDPKSIPEISDALIDGGVIMSDSYKYLSIGSGEVVKGNEAQTILTLEELPEKS